MRTKVVKVMMGLFVALMLGMFGCGGGGGGGGGGGSNVNSGSSETPVDVTGKWSGNFKSGSGVVGASATTISLVQNG